MFIKRKKKGYALFNVIIVLFIVSILSLLSMNIILSNRRREYMDIKYTDLNGLNISENYVSFINDKLNESEDLVNELFDKKEIKIYEKNIRKINYDYKKDLINIIIFKKGREFTVQCGYKYCDNLFIVYLINQAYVKG